MPTVETYSNAVVGFHMSVGGGVRVSAAVGGGVLLCCGRWGRHIVRICDGAAGGVHWCCNCMCIFFFDVLVMGIDAFPIRWAGGGAGIAVNRHNLVAYWRATFGITDTITVAHTFIYATLQAHMDTAAMHQCCRQLPGI